MKEHVHGNQTTRQYTQIYTRTKCCLLLVFCDISKDQIAEVERVINIVFQLMRRHTCMYICIERLTGNPVYMYICVQTNRMTKSEPETRSKKAEDTYTETDKVASCK